ncbi:MAG: protein phosphatase 2C domain-containing protein [Ruminococcus sp.]|nr:protein phosphatase 2C domain-containing protein [Ruminococcus sp.]
MYKGFSYSMTGASHIAKNKVCQDSAAHYAAKDFSVAVVADGHGSKKHFRSNIGSEIAVNCTLEVIKRFYADADEFNREFPKNHKRIMRNIERQIISEWNTKVNEHFNLNPVTDEEKSQFTPEEFAEISVESFYGTTLVAAVICKDFTFGFQIGDGSLIAVFEDGHTSMIIDYEESNPANITASMCNSNAISMFNSYYVDNKKIGAVFVSTDGLYTSFGSDLEFLNYHTIIADQISESDAFAESVSKNIQKRTNFGTQDDISLSCVYDEEILKANSEVIKNKIEENKRRLLARRPKPKK